VILHTVFDLAAAVAAMTVTALVYRWRLTDAGQKIEHAGIGYAAALLAGAAAGGFGAGTLNLWLSGAPGIGRSIVGALAGAILAIELFKRWRGTHGTPTSLPWGHDFGDGLLRHTVQLYESFTMLAFLVVALVLIGCRNPFFMRNGFYLLVLVYAGQRFAWEFLKPYGGVIGPFNLFHLICAGLVIYAVMMMRGQGKET
jgi:phosphatidylglycerol:prolipoprotein diacylglycerol transferase